MFGLRHKKRFSVFDYVGEALERAIEMREAGELPQAQIPPLPAQNGEGFSNELRTMNERL